MTAPSKSSRSGFSRARDRVSTAVGLRCAAQALWTLTMITDALPPRVRFGHWTRLLRGLSFGAVLPVVAPAGQRARARAPWVPPDVGPSMSCMLIAGDLDTGGVESVVAALARGLPTFGLDVEVVVRSGGRIAESLRHDGIRITQVQRGELSSYVGARRPDVIELHRVDASLLRELAPWASLTVPVFHAMESYVSAELWRQLAQFTARTPASVAVSRAVRDFFAGKIEGLAPVVVENGVPPIPLLSDEDRSAARSRVENALQMRLSEDDILVVALQRFSDQKNAAGLVDAFLLAAASDERLRLIIAGAPASWLEVRRAGVIRARHPSGDRVHLLGDSDASCLLTAADIFALDSLSEGGPVVAIEAAAHGVPIVLSDVGFARALAEDLGGGAFVVPRANADFSQRSLASQRRRRHQSNRDDFAEALLAAAQQSGARMSPRRGAVPQRFTESAMVASHARLLQASRACDPFDAAGSLP